MSNEAKDRRDNPLFVQVLEKGLDVLRSFTAQRKAMTLGEIAEATGVSKGSVQRLIYSLETMGYVGKHPKTRRFQLTPKVMAIGYNYLAADTLVDVANPFLAELANATGETTNLLEPSDLEMVYVARFASRRVIPIHMPIGSRVPMYCTASGRALLSAMPDEQCRSMLDSMSMVRHTPRTLIDVDRIAKKIAEARTVGYSMNLEELFVGDMVIGTPVIGSHGAPIAAVTVVTPPSRWSADAVIQEIVPKLLECARSITNSVRAMS